MINLRSKYEKILLILLFVLLGVTACDAEETTVDEQKTITMYINNPMMSVNNKETEIDPGYDTSPIIKNGHTLVPIRTIIENLGGRIEWNNTTQTISLYNNNDIVELTVNSNKTYFNGKEHIIDVAPVIINSRTYMPIRFISESFGFNVEWDKDVQKIVITKALNIAENKKESDLIDVIQDSDMIDVNIKINNKNFSAKLYNNKTTQQLIKQFPTTYSMLELHGNEKYYYMPDSLPTDSEKPNTINKGEIMLYGSDCLVVFYDTFPNSYSYTRLGYIEEVSNLKNAVGRGDVDISFELK